MSDLIRQATGRGQEPRRNAALVAGASEVEQATAALQRAREAGDDARVEEAEHILDRLFEQARASTAPGADGQPPPADFHLGVRGPSALPESDSSRMNAMFRDPNNVQGVTRARLADAA